jgi:hypothetical protein
MAPIVKNNTNGWMFAGVSGRFPGSDKERLAESGSALMLLMADARCHCGGSRASSWQKVGRGRDVDGTPILRELRRPFGVW